MLLMGAVIAAMMLFSPVSKAECDSKCQANALDVGSAAARELVFAEIKRDGKLGTLIRTEVILNECKKPGKAAAIKSIRVAHFKEVVEKRLDQPLGSMDDSPEAAGLQAGALAYSAEALQLGYAIGYGEMVGNLFELNKTARDVMCNGASKRADEMLFGDKVK